MNSPSETQKRTTIIVIIVIAVLVVLCLCLCCCGMGATSFMLMADAGLAPTPGPTPAPVDFRPAVPPDAGQDLQQRLAETSTTDTDYWQLYGQLESETGEPATRDPVQEPPEYQVGDVHTFWMSDEQAQRYWQIDAELHIKTDHAYFYVSDGTSFDADKLREAADLFESQIHPTNQRYFGSERMPGIDNDPRMTILVTNEMPFGIAGYFSTVDEYPSTMKPRSNEREMIYVTSSYLNDLEMFGQLLSHEYQHMIHWNQDLSEATWVNEGLSELAEETNGYESVLGGTQFWSNPDVQLTNWAEDSDDRLRNYAASKLYLSYLGEHYGGYEVLSRLAADDADSIDGINHVLQAGEHDVDFVDVFADWTAANLLGDSTVGDGQYDYDLRGYREPRMEAALEANATEYAGWVHQFGADYVEIDPQAGRSVTFEGSGLVRVAATDPHAGEFSWWSNRRNMMSSSLTRLVDLGDVESATLHFWTWHNIEDDFDYGYVMVSTDGGRTWETLPGMHTTDENPNNANFGQAYTGKSESWLEERIDLTPYAGQEVLLRFWYITDPGLNQPGWLIDDISIPEIGFSDDAEQEDSGWTVDGFVRSSNDLPQAYSVQLVEYGPQTSVRRLDLDTENKVEVELGVETDRAVLVVSGVTYWTSELAPYRVTIEP
ncbi:MAG: hypothetical protein GY832_37185 [Chloroflexi bacterium]|nr:hypothetical protein [Chloroflexota bacterium]